MFQKRLIIHVACNLTPHYDLTDPADQMDSRLVGSGHFRPKARLFKHFRDCITETGSFYVENRPPPPRAEADCPDVGSALKPKRCCANGRTGSFHRHPDTRARSVLQSAQQRSTDGEWHIRTKTTLGIDCHFLIQIVQGTLRMSIIDLLAQSQEGMAFALSQV